MKIKIFSILLIVFLFSSLATQAQDDSSVWKFVNLQTLSTTAKSKVAKERDQAVYLKLDTKALSARLDAAPKKRSNDRSKIIIHFPNQNGELEPFMVFEKSAMAPELQAQYPEIRSFVGKSIVNPAAIVRFSLSPQKGLTSTMSSDKKTVYIEPYSADLNYYSAFVKTNEDKIDEQFECASDELINQDFKPILKNKPKSLADGIERQYDIAIACTGEYAQFHGGTVGDVLAQMNIQLTLANAIFERDLGVTFSLVADNANVIFLDPNTDPYTGGEVNDWASQNQVVCNANISDFDIGHLFGKGGLPRPGIALAATVCFDGNAIAVTAPSSPTSLSTNNIFVHEVGHQFGATHTFSSCSQPNSNTIEPGSGSTIMSYAGNVCSGQIVQTIPDDYFHASSIQQMNEYIEYWAFCFTPTIYENPIPIANAGNDYTIPKSTAFKLSGSVSGASALGLTYTWEQYDNEKAASPPEADSPLGPNYRSLPPNNSPERYMPALATVVGGSLSTTWEVTPSVARTMDFAFTLRDNVISGATTNTDIMTVTVDGNSGPFAVTSQQTTETWYAESTRTVTWDVAGTDAGAVNATNVDIFLSTDGGLTFPTTLASAVPNSGSHTLTVPNLGFDTASARIMVAAKNNLFYAVNPVDFSIEQAEFEMLLDAKQQDICLSSTVDYTFTYKAYLGFTGTTTFSTTGLPAGITPSFSPTIATADDTAVTVTLTSDGSTTLGDYTFDLVGTSGGITYSEPLVVSVFDSSISALTIISPADAATGINPISVPFQWNDEPTAATYELDIALDAGFTSIIDSQTLITNTYNVALVSNTEYFWRVRAVNPCSSGAYTTASFTTSSDEVCEVGSSTDTPMPIPDAGSNPFIQSTPASSPINVNNSIDNITDVNVTINISHSNLGTVYATLTSPQGTEVLLVGTRTRTGTSFPDTIIDEEASNNLTYPYVGRFKTDASMFIAGGAQIFGDLSRLYGESASGDWTLKVYDNAQFNGTGTFNSWSIEICGTSAGVDAPVFSWDSATAASGSWNANTHWLYEGSSLLPSGNEILLIEGNAQPNMTNDLPNSNRHRIIFGSTNPVSRTISGSTENIFNMVDTDSPVIENTSGVAQTIDFPIRLGSTIFIKPTNGDLSFTKPINTNGNTFEIEGTLGSVVNLTNEVSGTGSVNTIGGGGTLNMSATNTYSGPTTIGSGTLNLSGNLPNSDVSVADGATLQISGNSVIKSLNLNTNASLVIDAGATLTLSGAANLITNNGNMTLNGTLILDTDITGTGTIIVDDGGILDIVNAGSTAIIPTYNIGSTLSYRNITGPVECGNEWNAGETLGAGVPYDVVLQGTTLNLSSNTDLETYTVTNNLQISSGSIDVQPHKSLHVQGDYSGGTSGVEINLHSDSQNYANLIIAGESNLEDISYSRFTHIAGSGTSGDNDLIASPVLNETVGDLATANPDLYRVGSIIALAVFNNNNTYENYDTATDAAVVLEPGTGYRSATTTGSPLVFTGQYTEGVVTQSITVGSGNFGNWNLIGNPYAAHISAEDFLNYEVATGVKNIDLMPSSSAGLYGYNAAHNNFWEILTLANAAGRFITPGQGFFVAADGVESNAHNITFTPGMQALANTDDFIAGRAGKSALVFLKLKAYTSTEFFTTDFYFNEASSKGLDHGYDAIIWGKEHGDLRLYSHLADLSSELKIGLQSLNMMHLEDVVIPLGVNGLKDQDLTFSIEQSQLPNDINVFLEDVVNGKVTLLNNESYSVTPNSDLSGTGRFYLTFTNKNTLSVGEDLSTRTLQVYVNNREKQLIIEGDLTKEAKFFLFDIQGRLISQSALKSVRSNAVDINHLSGGLYFVRVQDQNLNQTHKIIIE